MNVPKRLAEIRREVQSLKETTYKTYIGISVEVANIQYWELLEEHHRLMVRLGLIPEKAREHRIFRGVNITETHWQRRARDPHRPYWHKKRQAIVCPGPLVILVESSRQYLRAGMDVEFGCSFGGEWEPLRPGFFKDIGCLNSVGYELPEDTPVYGCQKVLWVLPNVRKPLVSGADTALLDRWLDDKIRDGFTHGDWHHYADVGLDGKATGKLFIVFTLYNSNRRELDRFGREKVYTRTYEGLWVRKQGWEHEPKMLKKA